MTANLQNELDTRLELIAPGSARLTLRGRLNSRTATDCWNSLEPTLRRSKLQTLDVDADGLEYCDGGGLALLRYLSMGLMTPGATVSMRGLSAGLEQLFHGFTTEDYNALRPSNSVKCHPLPEEVGSGIRQAASDLREQVEFLGNVTRNLLPTIVDRKRMRWTEVARVFEAAGANAVPIVSLISILVGLIIAFESTQTLAKFGAQIYVVNMIGIIMVRELGPLLAAVLLAGRSGSAFAAEIGTMKVNEELDALQTLGLDPIRFLVIQRMVAAILLTPLLGLYATFLGVTGGALVAFGLGYKWPLIFHQLAASLRMTDIAFGVTKGVAFGAIVSAVGCLRGLQTREGPSAVGVSTTRAVVTSIVLIVIADAVFSILFYCLKL
ncbi:MAG TPA: ABC transporter permease [Verrucomicrobiae bacterium]|nr:ABC transporter permease [Verrucomicrobiae bacterium]